MKKLSLFLAVILSAGVLISPVVSAQIRAFPMGPDVRVTPGSYCTQPSSYRYPARIPYCERNVNETLKMRVFQVYQQQLGYQINLRQRASYKIDHLIPLCAGGSNRQDNLWPQHVSVYTQTDPIEPLVCVLMAKNKLSQKDAVRLVFAAKNNLARVPEVMKILINLNQ